MVRNPSYLSPSRKTEERFLAKARDDDFAAGAGEQWLRAFGEIGIVGDFFPSGDFVLPLREFIAKTGERDSAEN